MRWAADTCVASARYDAKSRNSICLRRFEFDEFAVEYASHGEVLLSLLSAEHPAKFAAIDTSVVGYWPPDQEGFAAIVEKQGGSTSIANPIRELLGEYERVLVVTDEDGLRCLTDIENEVARFGVEPPTGLFLRVCSRKVIASR